MWGRSWQVRWTQMLEVESIRSGSGSSSRTCIFGIGSWSLHGSIRNTTKHLFSRQESITNSSQLSILSTVTDKLSSLAYPTIQSSDVAPAVFLLLRSSWSVTCCGRRILISHFRILLWNFIFLTTPLTLASIRTVLTWMNEETCVRKVVCFMVL